MGGISSINDEYHVDYKIFEKFGNMAATKL